MAAVKKNPLNSLQNEPHPAKQKYSYFSIRFLPNPIDGIYGFICPRGTAPDETVGKLLEEKLIKQMPQEYIFVAKTGKWTYLTAKKGTDLSKEDERYIEPSPKKENEQNAKTLFDNSINPIDQVKEAQEIEERRKNLQKESEINKKRSKKEYHETLEYYVDQKNKYIQLVNVLETFQKERRSLQKGIKNAKSQIDRLENKYPEYKNEYEKIMVEERQKRGLLQDYSIHQPNISSEKDTNIK